MSEPSECETSVIKCNALFFTYRINIYPASIYFFKTEVLQQVWFEGYRVIQSVQDKAWVAGNGHSLVKTHNAGLDALAYSLRASQEAVIHVVVLLVKGITIPCKARLVANRFLVRCTHQNKLVGVLVSENCIMVFCRE